MERTMAFVGWLSKTENLMHLGLASVFGAIAFRSSNQQQQIELLEREKDALQQHNKSVKNTMWGWKQDLFREAYDPSSPISISSVQAIYGESEASASSLGSGGEATNSAPSRPKFVV